MRNNETVGFFKEVGRIAQLKEIVDFDLPATVGIQFVGRPTGQLPNTMLTHIYPLAAVLPLVHNGVIENFADLKANYL